VGGTLVGVGFFYVAILVGGLTGAMCGLLLFYSASGLFSIPYIHLRKLVPVVTLKACFDTDIIKKLLQYSGALFFTISTLPIAQIVIRKLIEEHLGWKSVGYWQGVMKISDSYLSFVTIVLANYYLPRLSSKGTKEGLKQEVFHTLYNAIPVTILMSSCVYIFRDFIIIIIFTIEFQPMRDFFLFQMIGDCLKVCAYTIVYVAIAKL
jgi:hypothetical protein